MLTYLGILDKFRPKWCVWENVPGVLSSNAGRDFGSFLTALGELGYGFAYRVLDAQNFGVAQRRRRVFVVGCLGDWRSAAEVLFEPESLCRDSKKGRETREETSRCLTTGIGTRLDGETDQFVVKTYQGKQETTVAATLQTTCHEYSRADGFNTVVYENHPADSRVTEMGDVCSKVTSAWGTGGGNIPFALKSYALQGSMIGRAEKNGPQGDGVNEDISFTLNTTDRHAVASTFKIRGGCEGGGKGYGFDAYNNAVTGNVTKTLDTGSDYHHVPNIYSQNMAVRRLTPVECERLQGFPDGYTDIKLNGKQTPDGGRYKALGNSMAVPVMAWIGRRIQRIDND